MDHILLGHDMRPKSEHLEHYDPRNGNKHVDNPMYNQERQPPTDYRGAAYDRQPELIQKLFDFWLLFPVFGWRFLIPVKWIIYYLAMIWVILFSII
jgi:hypothetical protein